MGNVCFALGLSAAFRILGFATDPWLNDAAIHRIVGVPAGLQRTSSAPDSLAVVSWNIERGQAYGAVLANLESLQPDILLLQEVDFACRRTGFRDVARDLAGALHMNWVMAGEFQEIGEARDGGAALTGQAILSRFPIERAEALTFEAQDRWRWSINPAQPRRGGRMALKAQTGGLLVYNTHLESGGNKALQRRQINEILADYSIEAARGIPVLIAGDFNNGPIHQAGMFGDLGIATFVDALGDVEGRGPTSAGQAHPIDWIFVKNVTRLSGHVDIAAAGASDHLPVFAALQSLLPLALAQ
jgi:endonuclease/exonuclease/phosphatase family metal-dependent hydrolase